MLFNKDVIIIIIIIIAFSYWIQAVNKNSRNGLLVRAWW